MNLHLLDPSKLPDRIDSTLTIPRLLHPPMRKRSDEIALEAVVSPAPSPVDGATESTFEEVKMDKIPKKKSKLLFQKKINFVVMDRLRVCSKRNGGKVLWTFHQAHSVLERHHPCS
jgi:hypothetical protein